MVPVIGVTPTVCDGMVRLNRDYLKAVHYSGGVSLVISYNEKISDVLDIVDGVILSGGGDIHERFLNEERHPLARDICEERDAFEIEMCRQAIYRNMPVLGVCRGIQIMNIALGGTINQHVEGHFQKEERDAVSHSVRISEKSCLFEIVGKQLIEVNSFHHQCVENLGEGLRACAWAPDGVIEGIESEKKSFYVGVQWHPEALFMAKSEAKNLFDSFVFQSHLYHNKNSIRNRFL